MANGHSEVLHCRVGSLNGHPIMPKGWTQRPKEKKLVATHLIDGLALIESRWSGIDMKLIHFYNLYLDGFKKKFDFILF